MESAFKGGWPSPEKGDDAIEVKDALMLMFMFGMFILALLSYFACYADRPWGNLLYWS
ncbi:MAG TPA: putative holin-like toxin [Bacillales bacterium]